MREDKDRSGKWLLERHGDSALRLAGVTGFRAWRAVAAELVLPKQTPDGLLEVTFPDRPEPYPFLIEIATFPERRAEEQALRNALALYLQRGTLPEVVTLVLHPKGNYRLTGRQDRASPQGLTQVTWTWRVVELWTVPAETLLAADDVGLVPWVPLTRFDGPPEPILRQCRERIDRAPQEERANLLVVAQVMTRLRYNDAGLIAIFGGRQVMIESPLIQELVEEAARNTAHKYILLNLEARFGPVPENLAAQVCTILDEQRLQDLQRLASLCPDLEAFRAALLT
jgi:hypothetical protein